MNESKILVILIDDIIISVGVEKMVCQTSGQWSGAQPKCHKASGITYNGFLFTQDQNDTNCTRICLEQIVPQNHPSKNISFNNTCVFLFYIL